MIKCFHDWPTVEDPSAFMFHSNMHDLKDSTVGNKVLHVISSQRRKIESHAVPGHRIVSNSLASFQHHLSSPLSNTHARISSNANTGRRTVSNDLLMRFLLPISADEVAWKHPLSSAWSRKFGTPQPQDPVT